MIRPGTPADIPALVEIWLAASLQAHDFVPADFWCDQVDDMASIYLPGSELLVLEEAARPRAFAAMNGNHLAALFVDPACQGEGLGSQLLDVLKQKRHEIELCVFCANARALAFYQRHGFERVEQRTEPITGFSECLMRWVD